MYQLLRFAGAQSYLLETGLIARPLFYGVNLPFHKWLSTITGAQSRVSDVQASESLEAFQLACRDRFGTELPPSMYKRFQGTGNADVMIRKLDEWIAAFGITTARHILRRRPAVLTQDAAASRARLASVRALYGWTEDEVTRAVRRDALVISLTIERQSAWTERVASLLQLSRIEVGQIISRQPVLLGLSLDNIAAKVSSLRTTFPDVDVVPMITRSPSILCLKAETLTSKVLNLVSELGPLLSYDARQVLSASPRVMSQSSDTLMRKLYAIRTACSKDPKWIKGLQNMSPQSTASCFTYTEKAIARLKFYQTITTPAKFSFLTLLHMQENKFNALYPDFEEWWQNQQCGGGKVETNTPDKFTAQTYTNGLIASLSDRH